MKGLFSRWKKSWDVSIVSFILGSLITLTPAWYPIFKDWYRQDFHIAVHNARRTLGSINNKKLTVMCGSDSDQLEFDAAFYVTITNNSDRPNNIGGLIIEEKNKNEYIPMRRINCFRKTLVFNKKTKQYYDLFPNFDHQAYKTTISQGGIIQGWTFFRYATNFQVNSPDYNPILKITVVDLHGRRTREQTRISTNTDLNTIFPQAQIKVLEKPEWSN